MPVPFLRAEVTRLIAEGLAATVLAAGLSMGVVVARAQRQPETFFKTKVGLSDSEIQKIEHGHVVTKVLESGGYCGGVSCAHANRRGNVGELMSLSGSRKLG
jgi:hypothetical protein